MSWDFIPFIEHLLCTRHYAKLSALHILSPLTYREPRDVGMDIPFLPMRRLRAGTVSTSFSPVPPEPGMGLCTEKRCSDVPVAHQEPAVTCLTAQLAPQHRGSDNTALGTWKIFSKFGFLSSSLHPFIQMDLAEMHSLHLCSLNTVPSLDDWQLPGEE